MSVVEDFSASFGGRLVGSLFILVVLLLPLVAAQTLDLAESDPLLTTTTSTTRTASEVAAPAATSTTASQPESCEIVVIEAIFDAYRLVEVLEKGDRLDLQVESYEQSQRVTVAYIRYESEEELQRILGIVKVNGWSDSYVAVLDESECPRET